MKSALALFAFAALSPQQVPVTPTEPDAVDAPVLPVLDAAAAPVLVQSDGSRIGYADLVDLSDAAGVVAMATIGSSVAVEPERSPGLGAGHVRLYVEAAIDGVIRGASGLPGKVAYLVDVPLDSRGKPPRLKKQRVILFAAGTAPNGQLQLVAPDAQIAWSVEAETMVRDIQRAIISPSAAPIVTGIDSAFHVAGTLPGEGETQIFLTTKNGDPVSLNVLRRPGQQPVWAVAFGEILDESARTPAPGTLGWQRLACGLPARLPPASLAGGNPVQLRAVEADYRLIRDSIGPCGRLRTPR